MRTLTEVRMRARNLLRFFTAVLRHRGKISVSKEMKKGVAIFLTTGFAVMAIADVIHDFVANDVALYYLKRPHEMLLVILVSTLAGLFYFWLMRQTLRLRRKLKLMALSLIVIFTTALGGYFAFEGARLALQPRALISWSVPAIIIFGTFISAGLFACEAYALLKWPND